MKTLNLILFLSTLLFVGCTKQDPQIKDLTTIPQDPKYFIKNIEPLEKNYQISQNKQFNEKYFRPWDIKKLSFSKKEATWGHYYAKKEMYGFNKQPLEDDWFDTHIKNANYEKFNKIRKKAITIKNSHLRVFPTDRFMLGDPDEAGEGYPFDYNQVSAIKINTPIFISHYSKDKAWALVETNFALGWIKTSDIAVVNKHIIKKYKNAKLAVAIKDNFAVYKKGIFKEYIKLGTIFPIYKNKYLLVEKNHNQKAFIYYVKNKNIVNKPIAFNDENIQKISNELINEPYGWGGIMQTRDCSSMTKDFFTPFGIYLQRNSYGQIQDHKYISLENLSNKEKKEYIVKNAKPFKTLLYLKGHIMLYVGNKNGEPIMMHQVWGVKTKNKDGTEGRNVIGKTSITSLEVGKELSNYDEDSSIIGRLKGMVIVL